MIAKIIMETIVLRTGRNSTHKRWPTFSVGCIEQWDGTALAAAMGTIMHTKQTKTALVMRADHHKEIYVVLCIEVVDNVT